MKGTLPNLLSATICHFTDGEWHTESCHRGAGELEDTATWASEAETESLRLNKIHRQQHVYAQSALPPPSQHHALHCQPEERWERDFIRICWFFPPQFLLCGFISVLVLQRYHWSKRLGGRGYREGRRKKRRNKFGISQHIREFGPEEKDPCFHL